MQGIRKQIYSAMANVSRLCQDFFKKYPQNYPLQKPYETFPIFSYGGYPSIPNQLSMPLNPWIPPPQSQVAFTHANINTQIKKEKDQKFKEQKISRAMKSQDDNSKKTAKQIKKEQKKMEQLKREREKQKMKLESQKNKRKIKNTRKNQIKRDPRIAQKPKFPMSPYFLLLKEKRMNISPGTATLQSSKQFAEQMGRTWREMSEQKKMPYITAYLKEKRIFDQKINIFYEKYPDLKPRSHNKKEDVLYAADDPKYHNETQAIENQIEDQELQSDLIDGLNSQQDESNEQKYKVQTVESRSHLVNQKKRKDSLTLSDERLTSEVLIGNSPSHAVQID